MAFSAPMFPAELLIPTSEEFEKILTAKISYETSKANKSTADHEAWTKKNFVRTPWGIAYNLSKHKHSKSVAWASSHGKKAPDEKQDLLLRYFIIAISIGWDELIENIKRTLRLWGYTSKDIQHIAKTVWQDNTNLNQIIKALNDAQNSGKITLVEAVEKHETLNSKLFTKEDTLKDRVRDKMLEIVDEFLADLKEQDIKIKVDDVLLIGSNASYNYTKDSDIDLHILANTKAVKYEPEIGNSLYSAYRSLFNKSLDIKIFDIPLELFVEIEDSNRVSNGVYSVKNNKWIKKPVHEDIPEYDKEALGELVSKWEDKCKKLIDEIKDNKLEDEKKVIKMLEDIYDKLRKKGVAKGEYSTENLAFKELRNKGYLDKLKEYKNELVSKRLSLEEKLTQQARADVYNQIARAAGTSPIIQDNGMFFIYNLKASEISRIVNTLQKLPFVTDVHSYENSKYDFSNVLELAMNKIPSKYYDIRGKIDETLI